MRNGRITPWLSLLITGVAALPASQAVARTCCNRDFGMKPLKMPAGQEVDLKNFFEAMVIGPLMLPTVHCDCPRIEFYDYDAMKEAYDRVEKLSAAVRRQQRLPPMPSTSPPPEDQLDYLFVGTLTADKITGKTKRECDKEYPDDCWGGLLQGSFTFKVKLIDHHHDDEVLKEGSTTWTGDILFDVGSRVEELSRALFLPLDQIVRDYERIPESGRVTVPDDFVDAGSTVRISLSDLRDAGNQPAQWWQHILVKVDKGKILNAESKSGDHDVFQVCKSETGCTGTVEIQYRAPDACKNDRERLTIFNTCEKRKNFEPKPKKEIVKKEFDIICDRSLVTVTYTERWTVSNLPFGEVSLTGSRSFSETLKAELNRARKGDSTFDRVRYYEGTTAHLDLEDQFQQLTTREGCKVVAGWHGTKHGAVGGAVRLELNGSHELHLDSELKDDGPAWRTAFQWSGCAPWPDGACEKTDALSEGVVNLGSEMFTDSGPLRFEEDQDVIRGERRWSELGTGAPFQPEGRLYTSTNCSSGDAQTLFTSIIYYGLFNADRVEASKTITWEIRRPGASR